MADTEAERLRKRFVELREALGTQEAVARALGISVASVSRKERGEQPVSARDISALSNLALEATRLGNVPRGTSASTSYERVIGSVGRARVAESPSVIATDALPNRLEVLARNFEREMVRLGATDDEANYIHAALRNPEAAKLFYMGGTGKPLSPDRQEKQLHNLMEALRVWVQNCVADRDAEARRAARAKKPAPSES